MSLQGSLLARQERLKTQHIREWQYMEASACLKQFGKNSVTSGVVLLMEAIPCILHMEMRVGISIITMLLRVGLMNAKNNLLSWIPRTQR